MNFTEQRRLALLGRLRERFPTLTIDLQSLIFWTGTNIQRYYFGIGIGVEGAWATLLVQVKEVALESAEACQAFESQVAALLETARRHQICVPSPDLSTGV